MFALRVDEIIMMKIITIIIIIIVIITTITIRPITKQSFSGMN